VEDARQNAADLRAVGAAIGRWAENVELAAGVLLRKTHVGDESDNGVLLLKTHVGDECDNGVLV
jgi:hypothetical protein